jgi:hypothetical protein
LSQALLTKPSSTDFERKTKLWLQEIKDGGYSVQGIEAGVEIQLYSSRLICVMLRSGSKKKMSKYKYFRHSELVSESLSSDNEILK